MTDAQWHCLAFRAWRAQRGTEAVIPARKGRTPPPPPPPPAAPETHQARNAVERGLGWLKGWRRVAARYDKYAHRFLGFCTEQRLGAG